MPSNSYKALLDQLTSVDQLVAIHGKLQAGRGRRYEQDAIHRAGVVICVAAWQAYIEKIVAEALDALEASINNPATIPPAPHWVRHSFLLRRSEIETQLKKFNTPNSVNTRDLLKSAFGYNPWPIWIWQQGRRQWDDKKTRKRTEGWIRVRHSIAHGFPLPDDIDFLKGDNDNPRLTLGLLKECLKHFKHVAEKTDAGLNDFLVDKYGMPTPW